VVLLLLILAPIVQVEVLLLKLGGIIVKVIIGVLEENQLPQVVLTTTVTKMAVIIIKILMDQPIITIIKDIQSIRDQINKRRENKEEKKRRDRKRSWKGGMLS